MKTTPRFEQFKLWRNIIQRLQSRPMFKWVTVTITIKATAVTWSISSNFLLLPLP